MRKRGLTRSTSALRQTPAAKSAQRHTELSAHAAPTRGQPSNVRGARGNGGTVAWVRRASRPPSCCARAPKARRVGSSSVCECRSPTPSIGGLNLQDE
eukprot:scaffold90234_cov32-Tisochrysis_lutea.AAC.1